jgi:mannosyl-oligosaccharide alpha-1,2-mannosidase
MPGFRRWGRSKIQNNPGSYFKLLTAVLVVTLYLIIKEFSHPTVRTNTIVPTFGAHIQNSDWQNGTEEEDTERVKIIREAMKHTFWQYRRNAWGSDDIGPVTGKGYASRNGWGAFIVDSATTLAVMGLWDELAESVGFITKIDFSVSDDLVDPFETTIRYIGGLVSLIDLADSGVIPEKIISPDVRERILEQAVTLANALGPAYDTPTGMPWPRVNFSTGKGEPDPPSVYIEHPDQVRYDNPVISPARTGSSILENRVLTRLTGNPIYTQNSTLAWAPLVWSKWDTPWPGMVDAPLDITNGAPVGRQRHWDGGHDSYYEYLAKITLLAPRSDPHLPTYMRRFLDAAYSLRKNLASRSAPSAEHLTQHLFIGRQDGRWFLNRQGHLACFAPGTILLGATLYEEPALRTFALALLEGCHHAYSSTPSGIGPESWSWTPKFGSESPVYTPQTERQERELSDYGFWASDPRYKGRPEYMESLFYAYRITGQQRYRDWAWEAFSAMEKWCKAPFGYAQLADVFRPRPEEWPGKGEARWIDQQESFWAAETLKYAYLVFSDVDVGNLDAWVFSTEGHLFRMIR